MTNSLSLTQDLHPKKWISKFSQNSIRYLVIMGIFYHLLGMGLAIIASLLQIAILGEEEQYVPFVLSYLLFAGPIEETLFFGIPYYLSGNHYIVLGTGIFWSIMHLFNMETGIPSFENLTYSNFIFTIPVLFYSLRTWISGKGWFSILTHSFWNGVVFYITMLEGVDSWEIFGPGGFDDMTLLIVSVVLLGINYWLYRRRKDKKAR